MTTEMSDLDRIAERAAVASALWAQTSLFDRAAALVAIGDRLTESSDELVKAAMKETGLAQARLEGELKRTAVQLRLFAEVAANGSYLDVRIDEADANFVLGHRPDVRRYLVPIGPVLVFAASNFPFAFSVAGGDTASALAAGCAVVLKTHPGHPEVSALTAALVESALDDAGAPAGTFQSISGQDAGVAMLKHSKIAAGSFTGSTVVGKLLANVATSRPIPIPFYGELGSVNPTYVTSDALGQDAQSIVSGYVASVAGSAGQLCTKPGFMFMPAGHGQDSKLHELSSGAQEQRMLNPGIAAQYRDRREAVLNTPGVHVICEGSFRFDDGGQGWSTPTIVSVSLDLLRSHRDTLIEEAFGPLSIIVEYEQEADLVASAEDLFEGNLTGTIHAADGEESATLRALVDCIAKQSGRVIFDGWPTGVSVTPAMQHGGPWPATTSDSATSVGTAAISRFLRAVAYQDAPQALLPPPLRDANPWGVPQRRLPAGESHAWGTHFVTEEGVSK